MFLNSCKKSNNITSTLSEPCLFKNYNYYLPDSFYKQYNNLVDSGKTLKYYKFESSNGLEETIEINKLSPFNILKKPCYQNNYWGIYYAYQSNLYRNYFALLLDFKYDTHFPYGYSFGYADTTQVCLNIHLKQELLNSNGNIMYTLLIHNLLPFENSKLKIVEFFPDTTYYCDNCIEFIGEFKQNNMVYKNVTRYIYPLNSRLFPESIKEIFIDKHYGVLKVIKNDNTIWYVKPN